MMNPPSNHDKTDNPLNLLSSERAHVEKCIVSVFIMTSAIVFKTKIIGKFISNKWNEVGLGLLQLWDYYNDNVIVVYIKNAVYIL